MISHFQWKPLFKKKGFPAGNIVYHKGIHYEGIYHKSGEIEWGSTYPRMMTSLP
ncbi:DUF5342 family protein [Bacillus licheniformis]|nr:DUF5342 family protein [Bacillus licheniformis]